MKLLAACLLIKRAIGALFQGQNVAVLGGRAPFPCAKISSEQSGWRSIPGLVSGVQIITVIVVVP